MVLFFVENRTPELPDQNMASGSAGGKALSTAGGGKIDSAFLNRLEAICPVGSRACIGCGTGVRIKGE